MQIEAITPGALDRAEAVLRRGFPNRPTGFWKRVLAAMNNHCVDRSATPIGALLTDRGQDVGVLLTLESATCDEAVPRKLNLSSWYVEEQVRFWAPLMLKEAVRGSDLVTDLSPTAAVEPLNERLGVVRRIRGSMLIPTPLDSLRMSAACLSDAPKHTDSDLLRAHAGMGLISATLMTPEGLREPLIFLPTALRGIRGARLIYCRGLQLAQKHRGAIARFLLARKLMFLEIEANRADIWAGSVHAPSRCRVFAKGRLPIDAIDHSYTELAFIHAGSGAAS